MPDIEKVRRATEPVLLEHKKVWGVSHHTSNPHTVIYVQEEADKADMPSQIGGTPTDVRVSGEVYIQRQVIVQNKYIQKMRPLVGGVSCFACCEKAAGTLGVITNDGKILSNAHVLAIDFIESDWFERGHSVIQPGGLDMGTEDDKVGELESYAPIKFKDTTAENYVDAATATPLVDYQPMEILGVGALEGWTYPLVGMRVHKAGRTTGYSESVVTDTKATMKVEGYPGGWAVFRDVFVCVALSSGGDSGSYIATPDNIGVGPLFAGSELITIGCEAGHVIQELGVDLGPKVEYELLPQKMKMLPAALLPVGFVLAVIMVEEIRQKSQ